MQREESGFRGLYFGAHPHGIHLAAGPDLMHLMLEGLAMTVVTCTGNVLKAVGALGAVNKALANMHQRRHDPTGKFTWVRTGLQSLSQVSAEDMPGVLNSIILALGIYTRGGDDNLSLEILLGLQRVLYLFGVMYRNMKMRDHTATELEDLTMLILLFTGLCVV